MSRSKIDNNKIVQTAVQTPFFSLYIKCALFCLYQKKKIVIHPFQHIILNTFIIINFF